MTTDPQTVSMTILDTRTLAVALVRPAADLFYNWATTGWENPFNPANHLKAMSLMEPSPSLFSNVQYADLGDAFIDRTDVAALIVAVTSTGTPASVVDCWTLPSPVRIPTVGGFLR